MSFIERLKQKPPHIKTRYALLGATVVTLFIGVIWTTTLPARFSAISASIEEGDMNNAAVAEGGLTINDFIEGMQGKKDLQNEEVPPIPTGQEEVPITGALGELGGWESDRGNQNDGSGGVTKQETLPLVITESTTSVEATATPEEKAPTVILIGTTTKKNQ